MRKMLPEKDREIERPKKENEAVRRYDKSHGGFDDSSSAMGRMEKLEAELKSKNEKLRTLETSLSSQKADDE